MTEFGRIASSDWDDKGNDGSVGRLMPNVAARCVFTSNQDIAIIDSSLGS